MGSAREADQGAAEALRSAREVGKVGMGVRRGLGPARRADGGAAVSGCGEDRGTGGTVLDSDNQIFRTVLTIICIPSFLWGNFCLSPGCPMAPSF